MVVCVLRGKADVDAAEQAEHQGLTKTTMMARTSADRDEQRDEPDEDAGHEVVDAMFTMSRMLRVTRRTHVEKTSMGR
jgi:hypothetical protein